MLEKALRKSFRISMNLPLHAFPNKEHSSSTPDSTVCSPMPLIFVLYKLLYINTHTYVYVCLHETGLIKYNLLYPGQN